MSRIHSFDIIRTLACLMVILLHSVDMTPPPCPIYTRAISMIAEPGVCLFIMVSGALLLPVKMSYKDFVRRRLYKVLLPTILFSLFYIAVRYLYQEITADQILISILSIPFSPQGDNILWFMYTIIGLYLLAPVITPFLEKATKRELQFVLLLWVITLLLPLIQLFLDVKTGDTSMLHSFSGFAGYFVLGYYLVRYPVRLPLWLFPLLLLIPIAATFVCEIISIEVSFLRVLWFLSIFCLMQCVAWFQLILYTSNPGSPRLSSPHPNCSPRSPRVISELSPLHRFVRSFSLHSFYIYLIHMFVLKRISLPLLQSLTTATIPWASPQSPLTYPLSLLFLFLLTTVLSLLLSRLLSRLLVSLTSLLPKRQP